jgi:hypothetical protein
MLKEVGIEYPYPEPEVFTREKNCMGNLLQIAHKSGLFEKYLNKNGIQAGKFVPFLNNFSDEIILRIKEISHASILDYIIFSSELLVYVGEEFWDKLDKSFFEFEIQIILFVRDPFEHYISSLRQDAKVSSRVSLFSDLTDFTQGIVRKEIPVYGMVSRLVRSGLPVKVLRYETFKPDIVDAFFKHADLPRIGSGERKLSGFDYNMSLTHSETLICAAAAEALRNEGNLVATLAKILMSRPNERRKKGEFYSRSLHQQILDRVIDEIKKLNQVIIGDPIDTEPRDLPDSNLQVEFEDMREFLRALDRIYGLKDWDGRRFVGNQEQSADIPNEAIPAALMAVPYDFDPEAYLFHNPDVKNSGMDPIVHYLIHGRLEARRYKYL